MCYYISNGQYHRLQLAPSFEAQRELPNSTVCSIIRQFPRLQALDLPYRRYISSEDEPHAPPIILSSLTKLTLRLHSYSSLAGSQMLEALVLPNLTCLCLMGNWNPNTFRWILSLLVHARSNFELSKLTFGHHTAEFIDDDMWREIIRFLKAFPTISELSFRYRYLFPNAETILTRLAEETTMVPNLKVLILPNHNYFSISKKCLLVLANSRPDIYLEY